MIVVTGASGGLGRTLVADLAATDTVIGTYLSRVPSPSQDGVSWHRVDVTDAASVEAFAQNILPKAQRLTLVNLAGRSINRLAVQLTAEEWREVLDVNLTGAFLMSRALLKAMIRDKWGRIINVSSILARTGEPGACAYSASKAGLLGLTASLAREYSRYNVTVNCLALGYFDEGLIHQVPEKTKESLLARIPLRRFGAHSDLVAAIRYLIAADYVTGATLEVDGGLA